MLRMPCNFRGTPIERASWDRAVKLDLAACRGMRFDFYCADLTPISHLSFYLHSEGGWYSTSFGPSQRQGWNTVIIDKADMRIEEQPAGWGTIDTIRISAWRGKEADTEFYIANLGLEGADAPVAIVRGESSRKPSRGAGRPGAMVSRTITDTLDQLGLPFVVVSESDITAERLRGKSVVVLPNNPGLPDGVAEELARFLRGGGKLLAFYTLPQKLAAIAGVKVGARVEPSSPGRFAAIRAAAGGLPGLPAAVPQASWAICHAEPVPGQSRVVATWVNDQGQSTGEPAIVASGNCVFMTHLLLAEDPMARRALLLAMLGHLDPRLWEQAAASNLERIGRFGPFADFDEVAGRIRRDAQGDGRALRPLAEAEKLRGEALQAAAARRFSEAIDAAMQAREKTLHAYCAAQKPKPGEHRAWWCHSAMGVAGMSWDQAIKNLADNGFTAILPNMLWGGVAYYRSEVLPVAPEVQESGDQIAACLAACKKYGVQCHVWKVNWNMGSRTSAEFVEQMRSAGRTQLTYSGAPEPRWLCPSHPANQKLEIDSMVGVATKYAVDGIHFDYIRYPGGENCFCPGCRQRFEAALGAKVARWPSDTRNDPAIRQKWLDFRRDNITKVVAAVHEAVKKQRPGVKISAAVFRNWPADRDSVGQDWKLWCDRGYLDFVCPMDYTPSDAQFEAMVAQQLQWAGRVPCYPGIGLSTWGGPPDAAKVIEQIQTTRRLNTGGFTVFNYSVPEAARIVPLCGQGITRKE